MKKLNNIKINPNKKYRLYKAIAGVTLVVVTASFLYGCELTNPYDNYKPNSNGSYYQYNTNDQTQNQTQNQSSNINNLTTIDDYSLAYNIDLKSIFSKNLKLTDSDVKIIETEVSNIQVNYPYSNLYDSAVNLEKYNNLIKYNSKTQNIFNNNSITGDYIYQIVVANNAKENFKETARISDRDLKNICNKIAETINYVITKENIDLNLLSEKVQNLKIRNFTGFANGSYDSQTGIMWLDVSKLNSDQTIFRKAISHETIHMIQSNSLQEIIGSNVLSRLGPSYKFSDSRVNSIDWTWFEEGTAETLMMSETNSSEVLTYSTLIKLIEGVKLSTIINPNNEVSDLEYLSLDSNLNKLFDYFDCQTKEEKVEIINMMFGYEFISGVSSSSSVEEFYDIHESTYGKMDSAGKRLFETQLKGAIAQTLSKQFYQNLTKNINNKDVPITDVFEMISIYESQMNKLTWYAATGYAQNLNEFITNYISIQNNFFQILANKTNLSFEEIQLAYEIYNLVYENDFENIKILDGEKKDFVANVKKNRENDKTVTIRYFYTSENVKTK